MGICGTGLYAGDYAEDLKATTRTLAKLPFTGDEIVDHLIDQERDVAENPDDEDYTTFWLVVADQLQKRGIGSRAQSAAIAIIDGGSDLRMLEHLGMTATDLNRRAVMLAKLHDTLTAPLPDKTRRTLAKPQSYQLAPGEVIRFRVDRQGNCRNAYDTKNILEFEPTGWNTAVVLEVGREFDYLAWYYVAAPSVIRTDPPTLEDAVDDFNPDPKYAGCGTLSASHKRRMDLQTIGTIDVPKHRAPKRELRRGTVSSNISIGNVLNQWDRVGRRL